MDQILLQISNNPIIALSGWLATMVALVLAIAIPIIQRKRKSLSFKYQTNMLVTNKLSEVDGLAISFKNKPVDQLAVTIVEISNNGNRVIEKKDIYKGHELQVVSKDNVSILYSKLISESSDIIECKPVSINGVVNIDFQTFERKDSVTINIYHNGNKDTEFSVKGRIKEGKITDYSSKREIIKSKIRTSLFQSTFMCAAILLAARPVLFEEWRATIIALLLVFPFFFVITILPDIINYLLRLLKKTLEKQ